MTRQSFPSRQEAMDYAKFYPGSMITQEDPTLHCDYACLRSGCRQGCKRYDVVVPAAFHHHQEEVKERLCMSTDSAILAAAVKAAKDEYLTASSASNYAKKEQIHNVLVKAASNGEEAIYVTGALSPPLIKWLTDAGMKVEVTCDPRDGTSTTKVTLP